MDKIKITLPNKMVVEGEYEDVKKLLVSSGLIDPDEHYYYSASRGLLKVKDMETTHLRNAILKMYREWVSSLSLIADNKALLVAMRDGINDPTFIAMCTELYNRG